VIPILTARLSDADPQVRSDAAFDLCWIPSQDAIATLLAALHKESNANAKANILMAICQVGDLRALDDLIAAATAASAGKTENDHALLIELCRGLARIGDAKALPALGAIALHTDDEQTRSEAVEAFGYVSGLYKGNSPQEFWETGPVDPEKIRADMPIIKQWMASHPADAKS
jgi:HEAT repeat protein